MDILVQLNKMNLLRVTLSITTLNENIRRAMEPRTSTIAQRLKTLEILTKEGIPVNVNMAPIIYGINSNEIFDMAKQVGARGAHSLSYIMVRLNGSIATLFEEWVIKTFPERAEKIMNQIKETHGGTLNESRFKTRMKGEGKLAEQIADMFKVARQKFIAPQSIAPLDYTLFKQPHSHQITLF
jgi:DNA repair photolyase